jgi:hypothetical protein
MTAATFPPSTAESIYTGLVAKALELGDRPDRNWVLGDLALTIENWLGSIPVPGGALRRFAADIGVYYPDLRRCRQVAAAYPGSDRTVNSWGVYRTLAAQPDRAELVSAPMTRAEASELVRRRRGGVPRSPDGLIHDTNGWTPPPGLRGPRAAKRRREIMEEMAATGSTSRQIAERLGIVDDSVRRICKEEGITLRANQAVARKRARRDGNHMMASIADDLVAITPSFAMLDASELDPARVRDWIGVLRDAAWEITQLARRLERGTQ